ncbi:protein trichome birefringence-like 13 [Salvia hispanica]|uniref:protein trichome birefringence-like 13 n=1 Tax=Salvia hispanica TaxID=49212 RepID=UPI0020097B90|nr:protein trichome birefringence-like 13 [Salvia hispanica]
MAARAPHHSSKKLVPSNSSLAPRALISLLCAISLYFCFSLFRRDAPPPPPLFHPAVPAKSSGSCNYSGGRWIYDQSIRSPPRYDHTCKEIFKGWNCIAGNKSNAVDILRWRWKPRGCDLPPFDPWRFLEQFRDTSIGFVGDSLNRNMFVSLFCALRKVSAEVKKWRPAGADRGFTFLKYNLTIAYHRTNLLARYGRWSGGTSGVLESLGYKDGYRIDVDMPDGSWAAAPHFHDILIFNTGHWWWAPSKFDPLKTPMLFFEKGVPVTPPLTPNAGLDMVLRHMVSFVEMNARKNAILFFRTQSPRHFEGGNWDQGGSCPRVQPLAPREVEQLFSIENNGTNVETRLVNGHLYRALEGSKFQILEITRMSEFRADAHPSTAGGKRHDDCMHWCLPGLTDTWNDLFIAHLNNIKVRN